MDFGSTEEIFQLAIRVCCDDRPPTDAAAIFGETIPNKEALLWTLYNLHLNGKTQRLAVSGHQGESKGDLIVPGFEEMKKGLVELGVPDILIVPYPLSDRFPPSTDAEAIGLVEFCKTQGWQDIYVVAPPLHIFRVFVSLVSAAIKADANLRVWNYVADIQGWDQEIVHSQTAPKDRRYNLVLGELDKVEKYCQKGDLVSARAMIEYMNSRY